MPLPFCKTPVPKSRQNELSFGENFVIHERGVSLFVVLLSLIGILSVAALGILGFNNWQARSRAEAMEADAVRGVPQSTTIGQSSGRPTAREKSELMEAQEAARAQPGSAPVTLHDPNAIGKSSRSSPELTVGEFLKMGPRFKDAVDPVAYEKLNTQCRSLLDTIVGLLDKPEDSTAFREKLGNAERDFSARCVDQEAEAAQAKAEADQQARDAAQTRLLECAEQRKVLGRYREIVALTVSENYQERPGVIDLNRKSRRDALGENRKRVAVLEELIAARC